MEHIKVYLLDLPESVYGLTIYKCDDGMAYYTMIINAKISADEQIKTYEHEMSHINNGDFDKMVSAEEIETKYKIAV